MGVSWRFILASLIALFALLASGTETLAQTPLPRLDIIVPGSADGGFDKTHKLWRVCCAVRGWSTKYLFGTRPVQAA